MDLGVCWKLSEKELSRENFVEMCLSIWNIYNDGYYIILKFVHRKFIDRKILLKVLRIEHIEAFLNIDTFDEFFSFKYLKFTRNLFSLLLQLFKILLNPEK